MSAEYIQFNNLTIQVKRKPHLRRSRIRISTEGKIEIIASVKLKTALIEEFLKTSEKWILKNLEKFKELKKKNPEKKFVQGEGIYFFGKVLPLDFRKSFQKQLRVLPGDESIKILVPEKKWDDGMLMTPQPWTKELLKRHFKILFAGFAEPRVRLWARVMGVQPSSLGFRFQRTLWGSCNRDKAISLNCKLIGAPEEVIDYVIIHELAHLRFLNHGKAFWDFVETFSPNHLEHRYWLKTHSFALEL